MSDYESIIKRIEAGSKTAKFRPASAEDLESLAPFHLPNSVLDFYRRFEPYPYVERDVILMSIQAMLEANTVYGPGRYLSKHGYFAFAHNDGDCYCFDLRNSDGSDVPIVLVAVSVGDEQTTAEEFAERAKPIARNLSEFLEQFERWEVDTETI
jgi:hypothetical protein